MHLTKKQTTELLSKFASEKNGLNTVLEMVLDSLMLSERQEFLTQSESNKGNGYRLGHIFGHGTQLDLRIPRDRQSAFQPLILALFREQESYLKEVSFELYSKGLTTREIGNVLETIYGKHYSKSSISNMSQSFYEQMEAWRTRSLDSHYLAFYIDGLFVNFKRDNQYSNECVYIILGVKEDYTREVVAIVSYPTESASSWENIFSEIKERGVSSVGIIVSDSLSGVDKAIAKSFPGTPHQCCTVHLQRNLMSRVKPDDKKEIAQDLSRVFSPDKAEHTLEKGKMRFEEFKIRWKKKYPSMKKYLDNFKIEPYLTFLNYDHRVRRMLYTTNWIERFNKCCRRTLKVRGAFPSEESVLALITSVAIDKGDNHYSYPIYNFKFEPRLEKDKQQQKA